MLEIIKRHVRDFFFAKPSQARDRRSLEDELGDEWRESLQQVVDPGREEREAAQRAAALEEVRSQKGTGQPVTLEGYPGDWEAVELVVSDETTATFSLVDRQTGEWGQLGATDDGSVVVDLPDDQFSTNDAAGAFWQDGTATGIRLASVELRSDQRRIRVTCDLRADAPTESSSE